MPIDTEQKGERGDRYGTHAVISRQWRFVVCTPWRNPFGLTADHTQFRIIVVWFLWFRLFVAGLQSWVAVLWPISVSDGEPFFSPMLYPPTHPTVIGWDVFYPCGAHFWCTKLLFQIPPATPQPLGSHLWTLATAPKTQGPRDPGPVQSASCAGKLATKQKPPAIVQVLTPCLSAAKSFDVKWCKSWLGDWDYQKL